MGKILFKQMQKVRKYKTRYYIDAMGVVRLFWAGKWMPYEYVAERDKRFSL